MLQGKFAAAVVSLGLGAEPAGDGAFGTAGELAAGLTGSWTCGAALPPAAIGGRVRAALPATDADVFDGTGALFTIGTAE